MKRIRALVLISIVAIFAACSNDNANESATPTVTRDTTKVAGAGAKTPPKRTGSMPRDLSEPVAITKANTNRYDNSNLNNPKLDIPQRSVSSQASGEPIKTWVFECDDYAITARFETRDALVETPDGGFRLFPEDAHEGKKYKNDTATLWVSDDTATFEINGKRYEDCTHNPHSAVWEDARLRGVGFRAVGNEPGWLLEIGTTKIVFETNYGEDKFSFPTTVPELDPETMSATYDIQNFSHSLKVTLRNVPCADDMSGEQFDTSVEIRFDKKTTYRGCGRVLQ